MIQKYVKAEHLKFKRTLFRKLIFFVPICLILISIIFIFLNIGLSGFSNSIICNWCMPILALTISVLCHFVNNKDRKHKYRTIYSLPINLKKVFISKIILISWNMLIISLLLALIAIFSQLALSGTSNLINYIGYYVLGYCILWASALWQIPFCLFLDQKFGFISLILINIFASFLGGAFIALTPLFWFFPHSWTAVFMMTLFYIHPNGLPLNSDSGRILTFNNSLLLVVISIILLLIFSFMFSRWYSRKVNYK